VEEELPVIRTAQEFVVWLIPKIGKFLRDLRFTVGEKIERQALAVLEGLIRARYARQRTAMLDAVNVDLEVLRFLLRIAHDLRALPTKSYGEATEGKHVHCAGVMLPHIGLHCPGVSSVR
jgi:hypothetical protein